MQLYKVQSFSSLFNPFGLAIKLGRHRQLLWHFTRRNIELRHKGSVLGIVWALLNPFLVLCVYGFVFVFVFNSRFTNSKSETKWDYAMAIFLGLSIIQVFLEPLASAPTVIVNNPNYVKKVVFPLEILPLSILGSSLFHCLISLILVLLAAAFVGAGISVTALWLPVILLPVLFLSAGVAWLVAAVGVFLRDMNFITQFLSLLVMFFSAVFYSPDRIPSGFSLLRANPLLIDLEVSRNAVLWHMPPTWGQLGYLYSIGLVVCLAGYAIFSKLRPAFADVI